MFFINVFVSKAFGLHGHEHDTEHSSSEHETEDIEFIWKGVIVLLGLYIFFLLEVALHGLRDYLKEVK